MKTFDFGPSFGKPRLLLWLPQASVALFVMVLLAFAPSARASTAPPTNSLPVALNSWRFNDTTNWTSDLGYAPMSYSNIDFSGGDGTSLLLDSTNAAWVRYKVFENDGTTNLTVDSGSVILWFAPSWASTNHGGAGPGSWGRLLEAGTYTTNASYGWWSLYVDPDGVNLYFSTQTNGNGTNFITMPISWASNVWHLVALTYSSTNSLLYIDGVLATNGLGITFRPSLQVLTNGFTIGSDTNGLNQARGRFDDIGTYDHPIDSGAVSNVFSADYIYYRMNPLFAIFTSAPSTPDIVPIFNAVTGQGLLIPVSTNLSGCVTSSNVYVTNQIISFATNGTVNVTFTIAGGTNGIAYDVFANSVLPTTPSVASRWGWMGQGYQCTTYSLTNLPSNVFLILGTPKDTDQDGLTDAYERLVSRTDPTKADTIGDGMLDGWKVLWGLDALNDNSLQQTLRSNFGYTPTGWLNAISGIRSETLTNDFEGSILQAR